MSVETAKNITSITSTILFALAFVTGRFYVHFQSAIPDSFAKIKYGFLTKFILIADISGWGILGIYELISLAGRDNFYYIAAAIAFVNVIAFYRMYKSCNFSDFDDFFKKKLNTFKKSLKSKLTPSFSDSRSAPMPV